MGVSGSGKSTLGAALAARLGCAFLEGDDFHDTDCVARMASGQPLSDDDRWPWLERIGEAAWQAAQATGLVIVSCSALRRSYRDCLRLKMPGKSAFMLLDADPEDVARRIEARKGHFMSPRLISSQFAILELPGSDELALTLRASNDVQRLCDSACDWLGSDHEAQLSFATGDMRPQNLSLR